MKLQGLVQNLSEDNNKEDANKNDSLNNIAQLQSVINELLPMELFCSIAQQDNATWKAYLIATCAFLWMVSDQKRLTSVFECAHKVLSRIFSLVNLGSSYQGFMNQLARYNARLMEVIIPHFRELSKRKLKEFWFVSGFLLLGVDGSRFELAQTNSLKNAFAPKKKKNETKRKYKGRVKKYRSRQSEKARQKKAESPQLWLTLLWHIGSGLPYHWCIGPSDSSERDHAKTMIRGLPDEALIVADAGFIGYDFWSDIMEHNKNFVVRVGGNVKLLRKLGWATRERADTVYLWPKGKQKTQAPLVLRLIRVHDGKSPLCLVTNLEEEELSIETALEIYRKRWGIEVFFRTIKQTFERRKLRSTGATNAPLELEWSLITLWGMCLIGEECLHKAGHKISQLSPVKVIDAFRTAMRDYRVTYEEGDVSLKDALSQALGDTYKRYHAKTNPEYPRKSQKKKLHEPIIEIASQTLKKQAKDLKRNGVKIAT